MSQRKFVDHTHGQIKFVNEQFAARTHGQRANSICNQLKQRVQYNNILCVYLVSYKNILRTACE